MMLETVNNLAFTWDDDEFVKHLRDRITARGEHVQPTLGRRGLTRDLMTHKAKKGRQINTIADMCEAAGLDLDETLELIRRCLSPKA